MNNGKYHTLYSMRRSIAQRAYDEHLEEEYQFDDRELDKNDTKSQ